MQVLILQRLKKLEKTEINIYKNDTHDIQTRTIYNNS